MIYWERKLFIESNEILENLESLSATNEEIRKLHEFNDLMQREILKNLKLVYENQQINTRPSNILQGKIYRSPKFLNILKYILKKYTENR